MTQYVVTGAYVTVKTMTNEGPRILGLFAGAPWPADATEDATRHHLAMGLIEAVPEPPKPPQKQEAAAKLAAAKVAAQGTAEKLAKE